MPKNHNKFSVVYIIVQIHSLFLNMIYLNMYYQYTSDYSRKFNKSLKDLIYPQGQLLQVIKFIFNK